MTKLLTVIAATLVAIASIATGAEAAFNVRLNAPAGFSQLHKTGCGGGGGYRAYRKRVVRQSVRRAKPKVQVASRSVEKRAEVNDEASTVAAKTEARPEPAKAAVKTAQFENSSISTAKEVAEAVIEAPVKKVVKAATPSEEPAKKVASAIKDVGCKSFFATVGMTLSVPCAK